MRSPIRVIEQPLQAITERGRQSGGPGRVKEADADHIAQMGAVLVSPGGQLHTHQGFECGHLKLHGAFRFVDLGQSVLVVPPNFFAREEVRRRSGDVESIKIHHFGPSGGEILDELLLPVRATVDLGQSAELGVGAEDEIDTRAGPFEFTRLSIAALENVRCLRYRLPRRAHVEQVHEEVVGQRPRSLGEDAVPCVCQS